MKTTHRTRKLSHVARPYHKKIPLLSKMNRASTHIAHDVDAYVTHKPYRVMGLIMLAGVCVGYFIPRH